MDQIWKQDYPEHTFEIISAELPSGSAWLVNCLLELGVPIWNPWDVEVPGEWSRQSHYRYKYEEHQGLWQQSLPALKKGRYFNFDPSHSGRTSHRWPTTIGKGKKILFFVRDPRDMLYSHWRRCTHNLPDFTLTFEEFLQSKYHHYPLNYIDYVYSFLTLWQAELTQFDYQLIRFEDYKTDAFKTLKQALHFLGVKYSDKQIKAATLVSDFKVVKQVEDDLEMQGRLKQRFNYVSQPYEYLQHINRNIENLFGAAFNPLCQWMGYEPLSQVCSAANSQIELTNKWAKTMIQCIYNGQFDPVQVRPLYHLLMTELHNHKQQVER